MIFYNEEKFEFGAFFYSSIKTTRIFKKCYQKLNRIYVYSLKLTKHDRVIDYWCKVDYWYIHPTYIAIIQLTITYHAGTERYAHLY
jgi:hypothetical protein